MKKDIRNTIKETAYTLFNERGYRDVSMRNIADAISISVGNLTYHYKKKEDLIETVVLDQLAAYQKPAAPKNITELNQFFMQVLETRQSNRLCYLYYDQLQELCPKVADRQLGVLTGLFNTIKSAFRLLQEQGLLKREAFTNQYDVIIQALITICIYELPEPLYFGETVIQQKLMSLWSIVFSFLTEEGKRS